MSKESLYLIVAIALALTAASFFLSGHDSERVCFTNGGSIGTPAVTRPPAENPSKPIEATTRGYPFRFYEEPFPADCVTTAAASAGTFNTAHLAYDFLISLGAAAMLFVPSALVRWWRGPAMFGDDATRRV